MVTLLHGFVSLEPRKELVDPSNPVLMLGPLVCDILVLFVENVPSGLLDWLSDLLG